MTLKEEERIARERERREVYKNKEEYKDCELVKEFHRVLRYCTLQDIADSMQTNIINLFKNKATKADLQAHKEALVNRHYATIQYITETIEMVTECIPSNRYEIKDILHDLAYRLDKGMDPQLVCSIFRADVNLIYKNDNIPIYNKKDIQYERQRGFEEGYSKCLEILDNNSDEPSNRLAKLDLDK